MSEKEFNMIFSGRLRHYLELYEMTQAELAKRLGVGTKRLTENRWGPTVFCMSCILHVYFKIPITQTTV